MGIRFRKSFKAGPVRVNLSKSGIGASVGVKGARVGIDAKGNAYAAGGKGGVYFRENLGSKDGENTQANTRGGNVEEEKGKNVASFQMKSKTTAYLLWLFLGLLGAHKFYLKKTGMGILYLFTAGLFFIGWIIDLFTLGRQVDQHNKNSPSGPSAADLAALAQKDD
jgi:hypothetical protein